MYFILRWGQVIPVQVPKSGRTKIRSCGLRAKPEKGELAGAQTTPFSGLTTAPLSSSSSIRFLQFTGLTCPHRRKVYQRHLPAFLGLFQSEMPVNKWAGNEKGAAEGYENYVVYRPRLLLPAAIQLLTSHLSKQKTGPIGRSFLRGRRLWVGASEGA